MNYFILEFKLSALRVAQQKFPFSPRAGARPVWFKQEIAIRKSQNNILIIFLKERALSYTWYIASSESYSHFAPQGKILTRAATREPQRPKQIAAEKLN